MQIVSVRTAKYSYERQSEDEVSIKKDQMLMHIADASEPGWITVKPLQEPLEAQPVGLLPEEYTRIAVRMSCARVLFDYESMSEDELSVNAGITIDIYYNDSSSEWCLAGIGKKYGFVPKNYVEFSIEGNSSHQNSIQSFSNSGVSWNDEDSCSALSITKPPSKPTIDSAFIDSFLVSNNEDPFLKYIESVSIPKTLSTDELISLQNAFSATLIEGKKKTEVLLAFSKDGMFYLIIERSNVVFVSFPCSESVVESWQRKEIVLKHNNERFVFELEKENEIQKVKGHFGCIEQICSESVGCSSVEWDDTNLNENMNTFRNNVEELHPHADRSNNVLEESCEWNEAAEESCEWNENDNFDDFQVQPKGIEMRKQSPACNDEHLNENNVQEESCVWNEDEPISSEMINNTEEESCVWNEENAYSCLTSSSAVKNQSFHNENANCSSYEMNPNEEIQTERDAKIHNTKIQIDTKADDTFYKRDNPAIPSSISVSLKESLANCKLKPAPLQDKLNQNFQTKLSNEINQSPSMTNNNNDRVELKNASQQRKLPVPPGIPIKKDHSEAVVNAKPIDKRALPERKENEKLPVKQQSFNVNQKMAEQFSINSKISNQSKNDNHCKISNLNDTTKISNNNEKSHAPNLLSQLKPVNSIQSNYIPKTKEMPATESKPIIAKAFVPQPSSIKSGTNSTNNAQQPVKLEPKKLSVQSQAVPNKFQTSTAGIQQGADIQGLNAKLKSLLEMPKPISASASASTTQQSNIDSFNGNSREALIKSSAKISSHPSLHGTLMTHSIRTWNDRSGSFSTEAVYVGLEEGKVGLRKANGIKISVPIDSLSLQDIEHIKSFEPALATYFPTSFNNFNWLAFLTTYAGISPSSATAYAQLFVREKLDADCIAYLDRDMLKSFGIAEGEIIKILKTCHMYSQHQDKARQVEQQAYTSNMKALEIQSNLKQQQQQYQDQQRKMYQQMALQSKYPVLKSTSTKDDKYAVFKGLDPLYKK